MEDPKVLAVKLNEKLLHGKKMSATDLWALFGINKPKNDEPGTVIMRQNSVFSNVSRQVFKYLLIEHKKLVLKAHDYKDDGSSELVYFVPSPEEQAKLVTQRVRGKLRRALQDGITKASYVDRTSLSAKVTKEADRCITVMQKTLDTVSSTFEFARKLYHD